MSRLSPEEVEHVARLARLKLSEEEKKAYAEDLGEILEFAKQLNDIDQELQDESVNPTSNVLSLHNVFREDEVHESVSPGEALKNAEDHKDNQVKVPRILEG